MSASHVAPLEQPARFEILLRIRHPSIDPVLITRELGIEPEHTFMAGQPRSVGAPGSGVHSQSLWVGALRPQDWPASGRVGELIPAIGASVRRTLAADLGFALQLCAGSLHRHAALLRRIDAEGGQTKLMVEVDVSQLAGFTLTASLLQTLGELAVGIEFEFAAAEEPARRARAS